MKQNHTLAVLVVFACSVAVWLALLPRDGGFTRIRMSPSSGGMRGDQRSLLQEEDEDDVSGDTLLLFLAINAINNIVFGIPATIKSNIQKRLCLAGRSSFLVGECICNEDTLRSAIEQNDGDKFDLLILCPNLNINVTSEIDITEKAFRLTCALDLGNPDACSLTAVGNGTRFFVGAPVDATFQDIQFLKGSAAEGGAISVTGGKLRVQDGSFVNNTATDTGGALHVSNGTVILLGGPVFDGNTAVNGGNDIYIETGDDVNTTFVQCSPTTILTLPTFCDGSGGIVVEDIMFGDNETNFYTDCTNITANFEC